MKFFLFLLLIPACWGFQPIRPQKNAVTQLPMADEIQEYKKGLSTIGLNATDESEKVRYCL